jgi:hypothetical protein
MKKSPAPIIAAILLLLPVLYVGSYLAHFNTPQRQCHPDAIELNAHMKGRLRLDEAEELEESRK